jgi:peptidoglycan/LPS O-acetylase OafA/YrhL
MSSILRANPVTAGARATPAISDATRDRVRRRAMRVTAGITVISLALPVDLLLVNHTTGEEIWGPITAGMAALTGGLSLVFQAVRGGRRVARWALYALYATVAFLGFGGYNDHRLPRPADTVTDQRERPPLAPLVFTGMGIVGAVTLRAGTKGN